MIVQRRNIIECVLIFQTLKFGQYILTEFYGVYSKCVKLSPEECSARSKLKGIDGSEWKGWSMWFNSIYAQNLTIFCI